MARSEVLEMQAAVLVNSCRSRVLFQNDDWRIDCNRDWCSSTQIWIDIGIVGLAPRQYQYACAQPCSGGRAPARWDTCVAEPWRSRLGAPPPVRQWMLVDCGELLPHPSEGGRGRESFPRIIWARCHRRGRSRRAVRPRSARPWQRLRRHRSPHLAAVSIFGPAALLFAEGLASPDQFLFETRAEEEDIEVCAKRRTLSLEHRCRSR